MHYVTLEQIDHYLAKKAYAKKHFLLWRATKEVLQFGIVFVSVFLFSTILINANLFYHTVRNIFSSVKADDVGSTLTTLSAELNDDTTTNVLDDQSHFLEQQVKSSLQNSEVLPDHTETMSYYLSAKLKNETFQFNTLPPENRIIIAAIGVNAPIVDISVTTEQKLRHGDFDKELYSGVVKYPSTPDPGTTGNTLIFGHTSYYWRKNNPFAEVFAKMPALQTGDVIQTLWHGQLTEFEVVAKMVVYPDKVDDAYMKYTDGSYITLMGCYPIGSDARRMLIIAKKKTNSSSNHLTLPRP